ncbi:pyridoxal phosphate-dependent aminotransferase family protein [Lutimonas saemankumensis]|uniref:aminotransferase class I/II-fold pyridoxal phosphate-dependent enzyme n=1 Tax=Lutimonas saemankumensis TaxID=483016 RepID=UPI001CD1A446|nr:pyridoxal phosphate-dependent aminotransferase family protein [Lutimonas saemankumensis]MCA0933702.1 pyridoxal phosphate-dependent aminotransferase family protein [Lutimonas saemankumensis]
MNFPSKLKSKLKDRELGNTLRKLGEPKGLIDFSSNDYIGFSMEKSIALKSETDLKQIKHLNGSTGSRLLTGNFEIHTLLEKDLASFFKAESVLIFNSGYDANLGLLSSVPQRGDRIFYDEYSHASIRDGITLSNAKSFRFKHNDIEDLRKKLKATPSVGEDYVIVESVYSMDGDFAPIEKLVDLSVELNFKLVVDEAHSTGVFGPNGEGIVVQKQLESLVFARIHTFGKALGCHGAMIAGSSLLKEYLINFSRSFIYTTAPSPHTVLSVKNALLFLPTSKARSKLHKNISCFKENMIRFKLEDYFIESEGPIQSAVFGSPEKVKEISSRLANKGYDAKPILYPTVPLGEERIRFCIHSYNTTDEIQEVLFLLSTFV